MRSNAFDEFNLKLLKPSTWKTGDVYAAPGFEEIRPWDFDWASIRKNPEAFELGQVVKVSRVRTVVRLDGESKLFVKRAFLRNISFTSRLLMAFRAPKEKREIQSAAMFRRAGYIVPEPVLYASGRNEDGQPVTFLVLKSLSDEYLDARKYFNQIRSFEKPWAALARFTRSLHDGNQLHSDYRTDHIFFTNDPEKLEGDQHDFALIDLDGSRCGCPVSRTAREKALLQLVESLLMAGITTDDIQRFLSIYDPQNHWRFDGKALLQGAIRKHGSKPGRPLPNFQ